MIDVRACLRQMGYGTVEAQVYEKIKHWESWYRGNVDAFHSYRQYNGIKRVKMNRMKLGLAKKICEDKADLLLNEKVEINISDQKTKDYVENVLFENNYRAVANRLVELTSALGTGAFVEIVKDGKIEIDTISAEQIFPISWDNDEVKECAFASKLFTGGKDHIYLNIHVLEGGLYTIKNRFFAKNDEGECEEVEVEGIERDIFTGSNRAFFQIIRPNVVNSEDFSSPMGMSVFAGAIDVLKGIDIIYDSFINEFVLGKKRIFIDPSVVQVIVDEKSGRTTPRFDANDIAFYGLSGLQENKNVIEEINMELRIDEHIRAINSSLDMLSAKCGFGKSYYSFERGGMRTATEVISKNSDLFRRIKKDEIILDKALRDMVRAILYLANHFLGKGLCEDCDISINFDDSIIEDKSERRRQALIERNAGLIDDVRYFMETRSMTFEQAEDFVRQMKG